MKLLAAACTSSASAFLCIVFSSALYAATEPAAFVAPEVAVATISCKAEWNQFCEDQKTIHVPDGHKLCKQIVTAKEQTGDSAYEIVSTDNQGVTVKFHAIGNRDRNKQQGASIVLNVSLLGVRENVDCNSGAAAKSSVVTSAPVAAAPTSTSPAPASQASAPVETKAPATPASSEKTTRTTTSEPRPHACACSQWIDADKVFNCLANGHGRDNVTCDSYATTIQCVTSKDECHESQKENCPQIAGLNQTTSRKRIFVPDSPYCQKQ